MTYSEASKIFFWYCNDITEDLENFFDWYKIATSEAVAFGNAAVHSKKNVVGSYHRKVMAAFKKRVAKMFKKTDIEYDSSHIDKQFGSSHGK